jgi:hypothetical protein
MAQSNEEDPAGTSRGANTSTSNDGVRSNGETHSKANGDAQGQYTRAPQGEPFEPLTFIDTSKWDETEAPEPEYVVPGRIPAKQVTLFSGEGGSGKSLLAQQLCTAASLVDKEWFGVVPRYGSSIYLDAEELTEMRGGKILTHYGARWADTQPRLHLISRAGKDAVLGAYNGRYVAVPLRDQKRGRVFR